LIAVIARPDDEGASALVERWAARGAELLTPLDLAMAGWRFIPGIPDAGTAVLGGRRVPVRDLEAVVTRIAAVEPDDLPVLLPAERGYVAAEMNAFLIAWLDELRCPVINRPQPGSLCGPPWSPNEWQLAAASLGIDVPPESIELSLGVSPQPIPGATQTVAAVGDTCVGGSRNQQRQAVALAALAGVECLAVGFRREGGRPCAFASADVFIDVSDPTTAEALWRLVSGRAAAVA
jgi:hypothetical protein